MGIPQWVRQRLPQGPAGQPSGQTGADETFRQQARLGEAVSATGKAFLDILTSAENDAALSTSARLRDERMEKAFLDIASEPDPDKHQNIYEAARKDIDLYQPAREVVAAQWRQQNDQKNDWWVRRYNEMNNGARRHRLDADTQVNWASAIERADTEALAKTAKDRVAAGLWTQAQADFEGEEASRKIEWNDVQRIIDADPDAAVKGLSDANWLKAFPKVAGHAETLRAAQRDAWAIKGNRDRIKAEATRQAQEAGYAELRESFDKGELTPSMTRDYFNLGKIDVQGRDDLDRRQENRTKFARIEKEQTVTTGLWRMVQQGKPQKEIEAAIGSALTDGDIDADRAQWIKSLSLSERPVTTDRDTQFAVQAKVQQVVKGEATVKEGLAFLVQKAPGLSTNDFGRYQSQFYEIEINQAKPKMDWGAVWETEEVVDKVRTGEWDIQRATKEVGAIRPRLSDEEAKSLPGRVYAAAKEAGKSSRGEIAKMKLADLARARSTGFFVLGADQYSGESGGLASLDPKERARNDKRFVAIRREFTGWLDRHPDAGDDEIVAKYDQLISPTQNEVALGAWTRFWSAAGDEQENRRRQLWRSLQKGRTEEGVVMEAIREPQVQETTFSPEMLPPELAETWKYWQERGMTWEKFSQLIREESL